MFIKFVSTYLPLVFIVLLSTPTFARPCDDGLPTYNGCDSGGRLCKNGKVIGTCTPKPRNFAEWTDSSVVTADDRVSSENLASQIADHKFESDDEFYVLEFGRLGTNLVEITIGQAFESALYIITGNEITFFGTTFAITKSVWLVDRSGLVITSGHLRAQLKRVD